MTKEECEIETSKAIMEMRKRIAELEAQIEKMKCCENCEHNFDVDGTRSNHCVKCKNFSNWELDKE